MNPSLDQAIHAYRRALPLGELLEFSLTPLDRLNIPVQTLTLFAAMDLENPPLCWPLCEGIGYGRTEEEARVGAYGELTEEVSSGAALTRMPRLTGSYRELLARRGEAGLVDPVALCLEAGSPYTPDTVLEWVETRRLATGEGVLVPSEFVACSGMNAPPRSGITRLVTPVTNGHGAGSTPEMAQVHGLLELLQRDGNSVQYRALAGGVAVDPRTITDPVARNLLDLYDRAGVAVFVKVAATDFGMVNLYVVGYDREETAGGLPVMAAACGEAVHPVATVALRKALLEFAASRARLALFHGPLDAVARLAPPGYLESYRRFLNPADEEPRGLSGMRCWLRLSLAEMRRTLAPVFAVAEQITFGDLPTADDPALTTDKAALHREVVARLRAAGLDVLVADLSAPGSEVCAVKMIVPGLEVETMSYHRVGERNLRRLLARSGADAGFPVLAGLGEPPQGALPVPLTPAAQTRLGGRAWLNVRALDAVMEDFYVLYREPSRHIAAMFPEGDPTGMKKFSLADRPAIPSEVGATHHAGTSL